MIDRTRAPKAKLALGSTALDSDRFDALLWPTRDAERIVLVDGKQVATLPAEAPADKDLLLATAPGCYQQTIQSSESSDSRTELVSQPCPSRAASSRRARASR